MQRDFRAIVRCRSLRQSGDVFARSLSFCSTAPAAHARLPRRSPFSNSSELSRLQLWHNLAACTVWISEKQDFSDIQTIRTAQSMTVGRPELRHSARVSEPQCSQYPHCRLRRSSGSSACRPGCTSSRFCCQDSRHRSSRMRPTRYR